MRPPVAAIIVFLVATLLSVLVVPSAAAQGAPQHELLIGVDFDGTESFSSQDLFNDGIGGHTPGLDLNDQNGVVRSNDQIQYSLTWNVNEGDASGVTIRTQLPEGVMWLPDATTVTGVPFGCVDDASSSITGTDGRDLTCVIEGAQTQGSNGTVHARAFVGGLLDNTLLNLTGTIESGTAPVPVDSNTVTTTVSAIPRGNWIKGKPILDAVSGDVLAYEPDEIYLDVRDENNVGGRLFIWNLRLQPDGGIKGIEPIDDNVAIQFFDHFFDAVPSARLASAAMMPANALGQPRLPCGGYDGDDGYPFGQTSGAANATPATQTNIGVWACTDISGSYPMVQIDITGHDTQVIAPLNADLSPNASVLASGQVAMWASEQELLAKADVPRGIVNAIAGTNTPIAGGTDEVDPIQIAGVSAVVDELTSDSDSGTAAGLSNLVMYEYPDTPPSSGYRLFRHFIRYANGPYQETEFQDFDGKTYRWYDHNTLSLGGAGRVVTDGAGVDFGIVRQWDGDGQTPRANVVSVMFNLITLTSAEDPPAYSDPIHGCVQLDTTHQELVGMPPTYPVTVRGAYPGTADDAKFRINRAIVGATTGVPSSTIANVITGTQGNTQGTGFNVDYGGVVVDRGALDYVLEVGVGTNPGNDVLINGLSCNEGDVSQWVDASTGDLSQFITGTMIDGTPIYGGITHMRLRTMGNVPWQGNTKSGASFGSAALLGFQVRVKDDPNPGAQEAEQELMVFASRSSGEWDGTGQPTTSSCTNNAAWGALGDTGKNPATGWCNLPFQDDAAPANDATFVGDDFNEYDARAVESSLNDIPRLAHADKIFIVEAALAVTKENIAGPAQIVANGNEVEFALNPKVVGSSMDEIDNVVLTDALASTMSFVAFTVEPDPAVGTCSLSGGTAAVSPVDPALTVLVGQTIRCDYGDDLNGGWGSAGEGLVQFTVMIVGAEANSTLSNETKLNGRDANFPDVSKAQARSSAQVFTGAPFEESVIVKAIDTGVGDCDEYPFGPVDADSLPTEPVDWADRCERIAFETTSGSGSAQMGFTLEMANQGNTALTGVQFVDVLPHNGDEVEMGSNTGADGVPVPTLGDGRTPETATAGDVSFVGLTGDVGTVWFSMDAPTSVSRDPDRAIVDTVWCNGFGAASNYPGGIAGACPADATEVTAVFAEMSDIGVGEKITAVLELESVDHGCHDIWTNTFGARVAEIGLPVRSNDVSVMVDCVFDLALTKVPAPTWAPGLDWLTPGTSTVDFVIEVVNQGDPINNFEVTDYVDPAMFTFDPTLNLDGFANGLPYSWDATGVDPVVALNDPALLGSDSSSLAIARDDVIQIPVTLTVSTSYVPAGDLYNIAEISRFDSDTDALNGDSTTGAISDLDSTPDGVNDDVLIDDRVDLTAGTGDEDDHDIAVIPVYDVAIEKSNPTITQTASGWVATFDVTVMNQSNVAITTVEVLETPPTGLQYVGSTAGSVTLSDVGAVSVSVTNADPIYTVNSLAADDAVTFTISYDVTDVTAGPYSNSVQIASFQNVDAMTVADIDSTPNNDIDHAASNEDDDDIASVSLPFDLALIKKPVVDNPAFDDILDGVQNGDQILFHIEVVNQLSTIEDFDVIDYLTPGWVFDPTAQVSPLATFAGTLGGPTLPYTWDVSGPHPLALVDGVLPGGQSVLIPVVLTADIPNDPPMILENVAEISRFDDDGDPSNGDSSTGDIVDLDSTPDTDDGDLLVDDEFNDDGTVDEDDHDVALTAWYDVAIDKKFFDGTSCVEGPLAIDTTTPSVSYCLTVANEGPSDLFMVGFTDTPPAGLVFAMTDVMGSGVSEVSGGSYVVDELAPGASVTVQLTYTVDVASMTSSSLKNVVEVTEMFADAAGTFPAGDVDSFVDATPDGDDPDEDDEDAQTLTMPFDLALIKTLGPINGDQVTMYVTITNQSVAVEHVSITDYVDSAMWAPFDGAANPAAAATGTAVAPFSYTWDVADPENPVANLVPVTPGDKLGFGETLVVPVVLTIAQSWAGPTLENFAEISNFDDDGDPDNGDGADGTVVDIDSTPDGLDGNSDGETIDALDDAISGDGSPGSDEDDHDGLLVPVYDLALTKTLDPSSVQPLEPGDAVSFLIQVINQGSTWATNPSVVDYIDLTFFDAFDVSLGANASGVTSGGQMLNYVWTAGVVPSDAALTITGSFGPGETITVPITLKISETPTANLVTNTAEITSGTATDAAGTEVFDGADEPLTDRDSIPDGLDDDPAIDDVVDGSGGDEDDHDIADVFLAIPAIDIEKATNGVQSDTWLGEQIEAGEDITWTYEVTNTGTTALLNATVTDSDPLLSVVCAPATDNVIALLLPGETALCEAAGTAIAEPYENIGAVSGTPILPTDPNIDLSDPTSWPAESTAFTPTGQTNPQDQDASHYFGTDGSIVLEKSTNGIDADTAPGVALSPGDLVTWTYAVTNTSQVAMVGVAVTDSDIADAIDCGDGTNTIDLLLPSETIECTSVDPAIAIAGSYHNDSEVVGSGALPSDPAVALLDPANWPTDKELYDLTVAPLYTDQDPSNYFAFEGGLDLEKATNGFDSDTAPGELIAAGDAVRWIYVVTNNSNAPMINTTVTDSDVTVNVDCGGGSPVIPVLAVDETLTCDAVGIAVAGSYTNESTATGTPAIIDPLFPNTDPSDAASYVPAADVSTDEDPSNYFGTDPGINLEVSTNGEDTDDGQGPTLAAGEAVTWTYVVTNPGNMALTAVTVGDDDPDVVVDCGHDSNVIALLVPGQTITCSAVGTATVGDYESIANVKAAPSMPLDPESGCCDPADASSWPISPADYEDAGIDPVTAQDPSHYNGVLLEFDLALRKRLVSQSGANATFSIEVFNQGTVAAIDVTIVDYLPEGMAVIDPDWVDTGDGTASFVLAGPILAGESAMIEIDTVVTGAGAYENLAGIDAAAAVHPVTGAVIELSDIDSELGDSTSDAVVDDVTDNTLGDEDDSDVAQFEMLAEVQAAQRATFVHPTLLPTASEVTVVAVLQPEAQDIPTELALTGVDSALMAQTSLLLVVGGAALVLGSKRRRRTHSDLDWSTFC